MHDLSVDDWIAIIGGVVALASAIAAATPTDSDNRIVKALIRALDAFALNWGKRNPRNVEDEARKHRRRVGPLPAIATFLPLAGILALGACTTAQLERAVQTIRLTCYTLDGEPVTRLIGSADLDVTTETEEARAWRQAMCAGLAPVPEPRPVPPD